MAQGQVKISNTTVAARLDEVVNAASNFARLHRSLVVELQTNQYDRIGKAVGAVGDDGLPAADMGDAGLKAYDNLTAIKTCMDTAANIAANMDKNALGK